MKHFQIVCITLASISSVSLADDINEKYLERCSPIEYIENVEIGTWRYDGGFCKGTPHGNGTQSKNYVYLNGLYIKGTLVGRVSEHRMDGSRLIGPYVDGIKHGKFELYMGDDLVAVHFYKSGILKSERAPINMEQVYNGEYDDIGQCLGYGTFINPDSGIRYSGNWFDDALNGEGEIMFPDGSTYKGGFTDNLRSGFGVEVIVGKYTYSGLWYKGRMHGNGRLEYHDGCHYTGKFANGRRLGELTCPELLK
ncbi:hypothetical protein ACB571_001756 [Vibrio mimicus]